MVFIESAAFTRRLRTLAGVEEKNDKDEQEDLSTDERTIIRGMVAQLKSAGGTR